MIPKECKRLAEVDFPIAVVSKHSAREKSIRHGHPSTLHLWWARRPLAACRAMLLGLLLPDPCDKHCPKDFKEKARRLLPTVQGEVGPKDEDLRKSLLKFIGDFANWDLSTDRTYLEVSRGLVKAAHPEEIPLVVDPFAGGGSIPLEALRLGCETFASDLNPVACLILKVMLEDIPHYGPELAVDLRHAGQKIKEEAEKELSEFYPPDPDGSKPIAYLWARTVMCEAPNCGAEIPLMRSFWLCKKTSRKRALRYKMVRALNRHPHVEFEIFEPKKDSEVSEGTITRAKAACLCCNTVLSPDRVRAQLKEQRGGADVVFNDSGMRIGGAQLLAVVTLRTGEQGRHYRLPTDRDYEAVRRAQQRLKSILEEWEHTGKKELCPVPDEPTPAGGGSGAGRAFSLQKYGMMNFSDLYTSRQKTGFTVLCRAVANLPIESSVQIAIKNAMTLVISRCADYNSAYARWATSGEFVGNTFGRQALGPSWEFCETFLLSPESGGLPGAVEWVAKVIESQSAAVNFVGQSLLSDACEGRLPDETAVVWFTDPPYYDAVPYADLSDYFFVWQRRALSSKFLRDPFDLLNPLTPKIRELVQDELKMWGDKPKNRQFFEDRMTAAFREGRRILNNNGIASIVFAHKTTEGWEALLSGMIQGGWTITGSWPIATERPGRLRSRESAALATSVHLVCRPRPENAPVGDWGNVLRELPNRVGDWMERLQSEGIRGADLVFACIGPALEIYSRYSKVETAEGREVKLAEYLEKVWEVVGRIALEQVLGTADAKARNGAAGALEEDARLTALFLWTLQSTNGNNSASQQDKSPHPPFAKGGQGGINGDEIDEPLDENEEISKKKTKGFTLIFDVVRRFAQPLGIHLPEWEGRIIETKKGIVRLLSVEERAKQLFGEEGAQAVADQLEKDSRESLQGMLFPDVGEGAAPIVKGKRRQRKSRVEVSKEAFETRWEATTLDRVHAAMLLQASGRANALRSLLKAEQERGPEFLRLANALSALYPKGSEEKRLLDAMLLAVPR